MVDLPYDSELDSRFEVFVTVGLPNLPMAAYIQFRYRPRAYAEHQGYVRVGSLKITNEDLKGASGDRVEQFLENAIAMARLHCEQKGRELEDRQIFYHNLPFKWRSKVPARSIVS